MNSRKGGIVLESSIILASGILIGISYLLHSILPNFKRQKKYTTTATQILKSELELKQGSKGALTQLIAQKVVPTIERKVRIDTLFGRHFRKMYKLLDREESFEEMVGNKLTVSFVGVIPFFALPLVTKESLYFIGIPVWFIISFVLQMQGIKHQYKKRQMEISKDLPQLIDKMMIALEAGKPFIITFHQVQKSSGPRMEKMLKKLISNMQVMKATDAIDLFARETNIPVMYQFAVACKIGIENGYEESQNYFHLIKNEMKELRKTALEELTKSKPEKVNFLYGILVLHALLAVLIAFFEIFKQVNQI
jgi:Flp pilus assembly protein TadB